MYRASLRETNAINVTAHDRHILTYKIQSLSICYSPRLHFPTEEDTLNSLHAVVHFVHFV